MHTDICAAPGQPRAAHCFRSGPVSAPAPGGYMITMTDDRIDKRAADLLPEERAAGSADPRAQAEAILAESDEREDGPEAAPDTFLERRSSGETTR